MPAEPSAVGSRAALVTFIQELGDEFRADSQAWENNDLALLGFPGRLGR